MPDRIAVIILLAQGDSAFATLPTDKGEIIT